MTSAEAKNLLRACRPDSPDIHQPIFVEALALVQRDPELKAWWDAQQAVDQKISAKLKAVPVPAELRARLLQGTRPAAKKSRSRYSWLAIAAVVAFFFWIVSLGPTSENPKLASKDYNATVLPYLNNDNPSLAMLTPDHSKVGEWLKERQSPMGNLPPHLETMPSVGCQTYSVEGHHVSLICFAMASGKIAHLFVVEKKALSDPPGDSPLFTQKGSWSMAAWSEGSHSYLLATQAPSDELHRLL